MKVMHDVRSVVLDNGVKLVHVCIPNFPVSVSSFWSRAGSRNDTKGKEGTSHLFEHLLTTKTAKFPDRQTRLVELEKRGFLFNAFTSLETVQYYYVHPNETLDNAIMLLVDGFEDSIFENKEVEEEKQIIIDEERRNRNDPLSYIWRLANSSLWPDSQLARNFYGDSRSLGRIKLSDLHDFYLNFYKPENSTFVLINSRKNIEKQAARISKLNRSKHSFEKRVDSLGEKTDINFEKRDLDYSILSLSFITTAGINYRECLVLELIKNYLANGWTSKLISRSRVENKLTYWVSPSSDNLSDTGFLRFTMSADSKNIPEILKIFEEEIVLLKSRTIEDGVLEHHKNKFRSELMRNCLNTNFLNWWYGANMTSFGEPLPSIDKYIEDLDSVSSGDVKATANRYLNASNFSIAIIGRAQLLQDIPTFQ